MCHTLLFSRLSADHVFQIDDALARVSFFIEFCLARCHHDGVYVVALGLHLFHNREYLFEGGRFILEPIVTRVVLCLYLDQVK